MTVSKKESDKRLFVVLGPTAVGKTATCLALAAHLRSPVISADSRQIFKGLSIGTAAPTVAEQARARHYFVGTLALESPYSAARYGEDALSLIRSLFETHDNLVLSGGSLLYVDAVLGKIDDLPVVLPETRLRVRSMLEEQGLESLVGLLCRLDPLSAGRIDVRNPRRVTHALEICLQTSRPYSSFLGKEKPRLPFRTIKIGLYRTRSDLYARIDRRVEAMIDAGLVDEARRLLPYRSLNALNTVGYKETFEYLDGRLTLRQAAARICHNTHVYARKQLTRLAHYPDLVIFAADKTDAVLRYIDGQVAN